MDNSITGIAPLVLNIQLIYATIQIERPVAYNDIA